MKWNFHEEIDVKYLSAVYIFVHRADFICCAPSWLWASTRAVAWPTATVQFYALPGSPVMLGACKSLGRYHLTLIGPNPETRLPPCTFTQTCAATFLDFHTIAIRVIMRFAAIYRVTRSFYFEEAKSPFLSRPREPNTIISLDKSFPPKLKFK